MEILIIAALLVIAAETTYLTVSHSTKNTRTSKQTPIFVDTSVLIDGRIVAIAESGFMTSPLYIPRSVVGELQFLADNADSDKRSRARHGLDVVNELQALATVKTVIFNDGPKAEEGVDNRLLSLAKQHKGLLCTIDFNLNKVAQVEGITVLNVNDLAKTLRMAYLPGEKAKLELTQKGNEGHQAVGHLTDGTMVVVEHAHQSIGKVIEVEFIRSLQTAAGKMMFARPVTPQGRQNKLEKQPRQSAPVQAKQQKPQDASERQDSRPRRAQAQQPKPQAERPQQRRQGGQRNNRRRSPEDSLVELANKQ